MACETRQLTQAQREEGFQNQRTGVPQAVRPFSGAPTLENLVDYINRELFPAVKATRKAANDIYLQVADNAPSANPLGYYFSTETAAADPTVGRVRLNASPQNTATVLRISQTNGRLADVLPWLQVMSGSVTEPLGVITLADAINPGRFLRGDLDTMVDQGAYWDLGITLTEASHPDPFVDSEAVTLAFIPGVADNEGLGAQIPPDSITPIATDTFLGNISGSTDNPVAVPLADIDSTSITYDGTSHQFRRAALTGFAEAAANTNATTSAEPLISYSASANMSAERVATSSTSVTVSTGVASQVEWQRAALSGAIAATANSNATLFSGIRDNGSAETDRTNLNFVSSNDLTFTVTDDAANDELEITATFAPLVVTTEATGGTFTDYALPADTDVWDFTATSIISSVTGGTSGRRLIIGNAAAAGSGVTVTVQQFSGGTAANRFLLTKATTHVLHPGDSMEVMYISSRWRQLDANRALYRTNSSGLGVSRGRVNYVDSTSITYSNADVSADDEVTISPRRAALTGAIVASANSNATLFSGILDNGSAENDRTSLNFLSSTSITAAVTDDSGNDELELTWQRAALTGAVAASANSNATLFAGILDNGAAETDRTNLNFLSTTSVIAAITDDAGNDEMELTWQRAALTGFVDAAQNSNATTSAEPIVTYTASANMSAERVTTSSTSITVSTSVASQIEFQRAALTGDVTASANSNATTIANDAVSNAKLANMAAGTVKGRQIDAGTGDPVDLTGGEIAEIIRFANITTESVGGTFNDHALDTLTDTWAFTATSTVTGIAGGTTGRWLKIYNVAAAGSGVTVTLSQFSGSSGAGNRFLNRDAATIVLDPGGAAVYFYEGSRWRNYGVAGASAISDSDKGDITVSASGKTWTIDAGVVTLAKQANLAQSRIIGRSEGAGTGVPEALTPTQVVSIIDGETATWSGDHTFNGTNFAVNAGADALIGATSGIGLFAAHTPANVAAGDMVLNATGGIAINTEAVAVTSVATGVIDITAGDINLDATDDVFIDAADSIELTAGAAVRVLSAFALNSVISPTALSADQNDYNPTGWSSANVVRLSTNDATTRTITGAEAGYNGELKYLVALGPGDIQLQHENVSSAAGNRFRFASLTTYTLDPEDVVGIWYDAISTRWRVLSGILTI